MLIQIAILIVVIVVVVHAVFEYGKKQGYELAYQKGKDEGLHLGRQQILQENLVRDDLLAIREIRDIERKLELCGN